MALFLALGVALGNVHAAAPLPEAPWRYFTRGRGARLVPLDKVVAGKPFAAEKAGLLMRAAYDGQAPRRKPVTLVDRGDGTFALFDGKSTYWNARASGWHALVGVVKDPWAAQVKRTARPHARAYGYLVGRGAAPLSAAAMTAHLAQNGAKLPAGVLRGLAERYARAAAEPVGRVADARYGSPALGEVVIGLHRAQLASAEYLAARGPSPDSGTLDPLHAEDVASIAVALGQEAGFRGDDLVLLRVAAHVHDADRSFPREMITHEDHARGDAVLYARYKDAHQQSSVARARDLLTLARRAGAHASPRFERDLTAIVGRHELGGRPGRRTKIDRLTNVVRDADSLAFFSSNIVTYLGESGGDDDKLTQKIHYMLDRMSPAARRWVVDNVVRSPTHVLGPQGERGDPLIDRTRAILAATAGGS